MDLEKLKVVDLRKELQQRGLDTKGNKAVLVKRLKDAMEEESEKGSDKNPAVAQASDGDGSEEKEQSEEEEKDTKKFESRSRKEEVETSIKEEPKTPRKEETKQVKKEETESPNKDETKSPRKDFKAEHTSPEKKQKVDDKVQSKSPEKYPASKSQETESKPETNGDQSEDTKATDEEEEPESEEKMDTEITGSRGEKRKRGDEDEEVETRGEKRKREEKGSPEKSTAKKREKTPPKEDEPEIDYDKPQLSWYDSDLHLQVEKKTFLSAKPLNDGCMGYIWAGARASHGVSSGKVCFEVKIVEELKWEDPSKYMQERKEKDTQGHRYKIDRRKEKNRAKKETDAKSDDKTESEENKNQKSEKTGEPDENDEKSDENAEKSGEDPENVKKAEEKMETEETESKKETEDNTTVEEENVDKEKSDEGDGKSEKDIQNKDGEADKKDEEKMETDQDKEKTEETPKPELIPAHYFRVGFSLLGTSLQLGEVPHSYAYESTGKFVTDKQFQDYGVTFGVGDVVGAYLSIDDEFVTVAFTVNGILQSNPAISVARSEFPEENFTLFPHVLCRNYSYELNFGANEEPWFPHPEELEDYQFLQAVEEKIVGPRRPETRSDCEVILMIGLPGSGKTTWVKKHIGSTSDKVYTVIGNNPIFDRMTVDGQPLKTRFAGSWKMLVDKIQKCLNTLTDIASLRRRNFIIDQVNLAIDPSGLEIGCEEYGELFGKQHHHIALQGSAITTNVFPNAQRRKLRAFEGFKRKAVCVICEDEEHARRQKEHENDYGKSVPESTMLDLKAQMELPQKCDWLEELIFTDLDEEEARKKLKEYTEEANKKGYFRRWHARQDDKRNPRNFRDRRGYGGSRFDRYSQGGWSRPSAGGWSRDRRDSRGPPARDGWRQQARGPRATERERPRDSRSGYGSGRSYGGGRNSDGWENSSSWGTGNNQGGWNAQMYGSHGYGAWNQQGQGWKLGGGGNQSGYGQGSYGSSQGSYGSGQSGYGSGQGGYGNQGSYGGGQAGYGSGQGSYGQQNWNYYGQYGQQQGWGQAQTKGKAGGQQANYSQQDWAQYAKQYAQQQQAQARRK